MTFPSKLVAILALTSLLAGCATSPSGPSNNPRVAQYSWPTLTPVEAAKEMQSKDGIRISVASESFAPRFVTKREYRRAPALLIVANQYPADLRETQNVLAWPREVRFKVKIYNQLDRVLRLAGTVVAFQVAGKTMAVDKAKYEGFQSGIILPRQENEFEIIGPGFYELPDTATLALFLYDIVTETDAAGNATKRSNFEFFYSFAKEMKDQEVNTTTKRIYLNPDEAKLFMQRDGGGEPRWITMPELDAKYGSH